MALGFVYVMRNPAMPKIVKIGKTARDPAGRAQELQTTGVPSAFEIVYFGLFENYDDVERRVHDDLRGIREANNREFFRTTVEDAVYAVRRAGNSAPKYEEHVELDKSYIRAAEAKRFAEDEWSERMFDFRREIETAKKLRLGPSGFRVGRKSIGAPITTLIDPRPFGSLLGGTVQQNDHGALRTEIHDDYWETADGRGFKLLRPRSDDPRFGLRIGLKQSRFLDLLVDIPNLTERVRWTLEGSALERWRTFRQDHAFRSPKRVKFDFVKETARRTLPTFSLAE